MCAESVIICVLTMVNYVWPLFAVAPAVLTYPIVKDLSSDELGTIVDDGVSRYRSHPEMCTSNHIMALFNSGGGHRYPACSCECT